MNAKVIGKLTFFEQVAAGLHSSLVSIINNTDYEPGMSCNGGRYGYSTMFTLLRDGSWLVRHYCTSEFATCPRCGDYMSHEHDYCRDIYMTRQELVNYLLSIDWDARGEYIDTPAFKLVL